MSSSTEDLDSAVYDDEIVSSLADNLVKDKNSQALTLGLQRRSWFITLCTGAKKKPLTYTKSLSTIVEIEGKDPCLFIRVKLRLEPSEFDLNKLSVALNTLLQKKEKRALSSDPQIALPDTDPIEIVDKDSDADKISSITWTNLDTTAVEPVSFTLVKKDEKLVAGTAYKRTALKKVELTDELSAVGASITLMIVIEIAKKLHMHALVASLKPVYIIFQHAPVICTGS